MEPNQVTNQAPVQSASVVPKDSIVQDSGTKKGGKGAIIGMVIFAILALGGIGFGVWTWMDGNTQKDALNNQISDLKEQNSELLDKLNDAGVVIDIDSDDGESSSVANTGDYIYVGEWGLKIKIPETLEAVTYTYDYGDVYTFLAVSGVTKNSGQDLPDFARIENCQLGYVDRYSKKNVEMGMVPEFYPDPFMSDEEYNYYYLHPQGLCTEVDGYAQREQDAVSAIEGMLSDPNNYIKF